MELFSIENPETERIRRRSLDMAAIRDQFSDVSQAESNEIDPIMKADRESILKDLNESLNEFDQNHEKSSK